MVQNLETRLNTYSPAVLSLFRVVFGFMFAIHGTGRLFGWPEGVTTPAHPECGPSGGPGSSNLLPVCSS
jgi:uncharacterized membrane protein YphA (DoxX/SURF4 family)